MELRFGVKLSQLNLRDDATALKRARMVEMLGFDSVWTGEHILSQFPTSDAFVGMAAMAALTERVAIGSAVVLLPLRPPAVVAKALATIDRLSGGRAILGIGVGGEFAAEFEACGVPVNERGARADEAIAILRRLWTESPTSYEGRFYRFENAGLNPLPLQQPIPIWIGGRSEAAFRRAGLSGDGFMPYLFDVQRYRHAVSKVRVYAEQAGRDPDGITWALQQYICMADSYDEAHDLASQRLSHLGTQRAERTVARYCVLGTPEQCIRRLEEFVEAGTRHFILVPICPEGQLDQHLEAYRSMLLPHFHTQ